ncbi:MAG: phosphoribosylamine--glycine ligase, partial [Phycisphaerales bacterium]
MTTCPSNCNVLLIGSGGREHALGEAIARSPRLGKLYISAGSNPGLANLGTPVDLSLDPREFYRAAAFCDKHEINLVVIGPEDPLANGLADALAGPDGPRRRLVFGPTKAGARLEADKAYAKQLMRAASIPTAEGRTFENHEAAHHYLESRDEPQVIKAAGLAKGKGVIVPKDTAEGLEALERMMVARAFGDAGRKVVIEERLTGPEVSVLALVDGRHIMVLPACQDHKRLRDGDEGPNTGGMGAFCPAETVDDAMLTRIEREVLVPIVDAMRRDDIEFRGVLYAGLMLTPSGPKTLEFNVRFGDPECQPLMTRLESDALELLWATAAGELDRVDVRWSTDAAVTLVLASHGYPDEPRKGDVITGLDAASAIPGVHVHHAGTARNADGQIVTAGGRVLGVTGTAPTLQ